jgi:hypothetical protein
MKFPNRRLWLLFLNIFFFLANGVCSIREIMEHLYTNAFFNFCAFLFLGIITWFCRSIYYKEN